MKKNIFIRMKQKRQRNVQWDGINHVIVVCIVFLDIMSDLMIMMGKTFVWNANDSLKRETGLLQKQSHFRYNGEYKVGVI